MNLEELTKNVGQFFQVRPRVIRTTLLVRVLRRLRLLEVGSVIPKRGRVKVDYEWRLDDVSVPAGTVTLSCLRTGHKMTLKGDNVREYRTPNFILLRCRVTLDGDRVHIEPFAGAV